MAGLTHLVMNRKPFFNYLHTRFHGHEMPRAEGMVAVVALVWGTLANVPAISFLLDLDERAGGQGRSAWSARLRQCRR